MATNTETITRIPGPSPLPFLGNLLDIDLEDGINSLMAIGRKYGSIFVVEFGGQKEYFICSQKLLDELCDEKRFHKLVSSGVEKLRPLGGDGLFTAQHNNHEWEVAHRVLMPLFGPLKIADMFEGMQDVCEQLCLKWARLGSSTPIDVTEDFTRLTLDTLALCTMGFRFNSFYSNEKMHPFVESMAAALGEADKQAVYPEFINACRIRASSKFKKHTRSMKDLCRQLIEDRRRNPSAEPDLLNAMISGRDPKTGDKMSDESIISNLITFLIAGHETTSGLLSFTFYYLLENPRTLQKAREEVDAVIGSGYLNVRHLAKLPYIDIVLRETLRLMPTAPGFYVTPYKDCLLDGKYSVSAGDPLFVFLHQVHRDAEVWGRDADGFKPERMADDVFGKLPRNSWKPFGNGMRGCIGKAFAWQEAQLALAMLLLNFDLSKANPNYKLKIKSTLTIKPMGFEILLKLREGKQVSRMFKSASPSPKTRSGTATSSIPPIMAGSEMPISIFFGSNTGTCEWLARCLSSQCAAFGFASPVPKPLNSAVKDLSKDGPVIIIAASYEGEPSDNGVEFVRWMDGLKSEQLKGIQYAVFGCGHKDWTSSLFKVPKHLDSCLQQKGAERLVAPGLVDTSAGSLQSDFDNWMSQTLWPTLTEKYGSTSSPDTETRLGVDLKVTIEKRQKVSLRDGFMGAEVIDSSLLSSPGVPRKQRLTLKLPEKMAYKAGDHLQILPMNDAGLVKEAFSLFSIESDTMLTISSKWPTFLPVNTPVTAADLFGTLVELSQVISHRNLETLANHTSDGDTKKTLHALASTSYQSVVLAKRMSVMDVLIKYPLINLPVSKFLSMLPQMRPRTYSFASASSWKPGQGTLLFSVVDPDPTQAQSRHNLGGLATTYMANLKPKDVIAVSLKPSMMELTAPFSLSSPQRSIIMIAVGAGLAPFHGLIQQRYLESEQTARANLAPCVLFFGCRGAQQDDICRDSLSQYERAGIVSIFRAYSRQGDAECKYVQDSIAKHHGMIAKHWGSGAVIMICSGKKVSDSVLDVLRPILMAEDKRQGKASRLTDEQWRKSLPKDRLVLEVFG